MKALIWMEKNKIEIQNVEKPRITEKEALVEVSYAGICGSDLTIKSGKHPRAEPPLILGHEFIGKVHEVYNEENRDLLGHRVVVEPLLSCGSCIQCKMGNNHVCEHLKLLGVETDGGFAEYVKVPADKIYLLPESINDREATLIEPLAVAVHAADFIDPVHTDSAMVVGAGPIGLLIAEVLKAKGVKLVRISDVSQFRLDIAKTLGTEVIDASQNDTVQKIMEITKGRGVDAVFDAAGVPELCSGFISMASIKGRIIMVAIHKRPCEMFLQQLSYKELSIYGTRIYATGDFPKAIKLLADKKVKTEPLITHEFDFQNVVSGFEAAEAAEKSCKVIVAIKK